MSFGGSPGTSVDFPGGMYLGTGIAYAVSTEAWSYAVPFAVIGWLIALYHTLLTYKIIPETISSCQSGISCAQITWSIFDFVTIPLLSFLAFSVLIVLYIINRNK
jgi:disulfide bond formation protein DsbB